MPIDLAMLNEMIAVAHRLLTEPLTRPEDEPGEHDHDRARALVRDAVVLAHDRGRTARLRDDNDGERNLAYLLVSDAFAARLLN